MKISTLSRSASDSCRGGELLRICERLAIDFERRRDELGRDVVRELVVVAVIADERRGQRVELQLPLEVILEQAMQRGRVGARAGACGWRIALRSRACSQASRERDGCHQSMSSQHGPGSFGAGEAGSFRSGEGKGKPDLC